MNSSQYRRNHLACHNLQVPIFSCFSHFCEQRYLCSTNGLETLHLLCVFRLTQYLSLILPCYFSNRKTKWSFIAHKLNALNLLHFPFYSYSSVHTKLLKVPSYPYLTYVVLISYTNVVLVNMVLEDIALGPLAHMQNLQFFVCTIKTELYLCLCAWPFL